MATITTSDTDEIQEAVTGKADADEAMEGKLSNAQQAALYFARKQRRNRPPSLVAIGNLFVSASASNGDAVGALKVANGVASYTFSLTNDAGGAFSVTGDSLEVADATKLVANSYMAIEAQADDGNGNTLTVGVLIHVTA